MCDCDTCTELQRIGIAGSAPECVRTVIRIIEWAQHRREIFAAFPEMSKGL